MASPTAIRSGTAPLASLTAVFTPPCPTSWLLTTTRLLSQYPAFPRTGPASCDPPAWRTNIAGAGFQFYSPAICPHGFAVGPNCGLTKTRTQEGFPTIAPGETAVYCVPIGLTCTTDTSDFRGGVWGFARDATTEGALVTVGPALQIRWVEADLTMLETHPLTPGLKLARTDAGARTTSTIPPPSTTALGSPTVNGARSQQSSESGQSSSSPPVTQTETIHLDDSISFIYETGSPTSDLGAASTASSDANGEGGIGSLNRATSIVVIVVVTVVAGILLWTAAFLLIRRYRRGGNRRESQRSFGDEAGLERGARDAKYNSGLASIVSPGAISELDGGPPVIGSTPNPAELEGNDLGQSPARPWVHRRSFLKSPAINHPQYSPRSVQSRISARRTVRESFGEKVNDPATALGRLRIPNPLVTMARASPSSASPRGGSFWRLPRSPRSPSTAARLSAQLPKPSPRSGLSGNTSRPTTPGRRQGRQSDSDGTRDATP